MCGMQLGIGNIFLEGIKQVAHHGWIASIQLGNFQRRGSKSELYGKMLSNILVGHRPPPV